MVTLHMWSLDDIWTYYKQGDLHKEAVYDHKGARDGEIELRKGDTVVVRLADMTWYGRNKGQGAKNRVVGRERGRNLRTNRVGLYPEYKTREKIKIAKLPSYSHVTARRNYEAADV